MVGLMGRILNGGVDVLPFEEGVIGENLVETCAAGQKLKNVGYTNALSTNAGAASAFAFFDGDSPESIGAHTRAALPSLTWQVVLLVLGRLGEEAGEYWRPAGGPGRRPTLAPGIGHDEGIIGCEGRSLYTTRLIVTDHGESRDPGRIRPL